MNYKNILDVINLIQHIQKKYHFKKVNIVISPFGMTFASYSNNTIYIDISEAKNLKMFEVALLHEYGHIDSVRRGRTLPSESTYWHEYAANKYVLDQVRKDKALSKQFCKYLNFLYDDHAHAAEDILKEMGL